MQEPIQKKLFGGSIGKFVAISIVASILITMLLTTILSLFVLRKISLELLLMNSLIGVIVPAIVVSFVLNLLKKTINWEQVNQDLKQENIERRKLEIEAMQKAQDMRSINELAIECAAAAPDTDIIKLVAEKLRKITDALAVTIATYDPDSRTVITKYIAVSSKVLSVANQLLGRNLLGMVNHITPELEAYMLSVTLETFSDLSEISLGAIPKSVAVAIKNALGVGKFIGVTLAHGGKLIGTAIIVQSDGQSELDPEVCKTLAHVSAVSIQRKKIEDSLRESETKFRAIIENLSEGIFLVNEQGCIIEWNQSQEMLTGYKREDIIGQLVWDVQYQITPDSRRTPKYREILKQQLQKILSSGRFENFNRPMEVEIRSLRGDTKHVLQTSFPIQTDTGYRVGSIMRDISSQKQAEADRERLITELKSKNTELEQFTYTVSHDLKAPLITVKGFLGLLEKDAFDGNLERMKMDMVRISDATNKMQLLLNELLELSRIGRIVNPSQEVPFQAIVQDAIDAVHGRLEAHGTKVEIAGDLPVVFVDRIRVVQVVQNLLDNAAKFMGDQVDPRIMVGMDGYDKDGKPILYVKDNGIGIDPLQIGKVFGLFQKLDANEDGTGIGLSLAKRIIEVHGGRIWITSDGIGRGTTVWFTLTFHEGSGTI